MVSQISGTDPAPLAMASTGEAAFDTALDKAQRSTITPAQEEMMIERAIAVGGQMIIMPRANDILNEAMSDD